MLNLFNIVPVYSQVKMPIKWTIVCYLIAIEELCH